MAATHEESDSSLFAPANCPVCGARVTARDARCEDRLDPARSYGCPECGTWLLRNERMRVRWARLLGVLLLVQGLGLGVQQLLPALLPQGASAVLLAIVPAACVGLGAALAVHVGIRRIGPALVPVGSLESESVPVGRRRSQ